MASVLSMQPFEYYSQVYGLDDVILPAAVTTTASQLLPLTAASSQALPWIVFTSALNAEQFQAYRDMFYKITAAMGLKENEFVLHLQNSDLPIQPGTQVCVSFGKVSSSSSKATQTGWNDVNESAWKNLTVPSLEDMAQNPELKKTAWTLLKQSLDFRRAF